MADPSKNDTYPSVTPNTPPPSAGSAAPRTPALMGDSGHTSSSDSGPQSLRQKQKRNKPTLSCGECVERKTKVRNRRKGKALLCSNNALPSRPYSQPFCPCCVSFPLSLGTRPPLNTDFKVIKLKLMYILTLTPPFTVRPRKTRVSCLRQATECLQVL
jgi:hypothetical protein